MTDTIRPAIDWRLCLGLPDTRLPHAGLALQPAGGGNAGQPCIGPLRTPCRSVRNAA
jgi:hypothetical protein